MSMNIHMEGINLPQTTTEESKKIMGSHYEDEYISFYTNSEDYIEALKVLCECYVYSQHYKAAGQVSNLLVNAVEISDKLDCYLDFDYDTKTVAMLFARDLQGLNINFPDIQVW